MKLESINSQIANWNYANTIWMDDDINQKQKDHLLPKVGSDRRTE